MALIHSLPPELLLEIFHHAVPASSTCTYYGNEYGERTSTLRSCSLVHSNWKDVAQELLGKIVWVGKFYFEGGDDQKLSVKAEQLSRSASKLVPKVLRVDGSMDVVLDVTGDAMWREITEVQNRSDAGSETNLDVFTRFPSGSFRYPSQLTS
jgi:hypothetical protein